MSFNIIYILRSNKYKNTKDHVDHFYTYHAKPALIVGFFVYSIRLILKLNNQNDLTDFHS